MSKSPGTSKFNAVQRAEFTHTFLSGMNGMRPHNDFCVVSDWCDRGIAPAAPDKSNIHQLIEA